MVDLVEGRLDAAAIERVTAHLDVCGSCRELVADAVRGMDAPPAPGGGAPRGAPVARGVCVGRYVVLDRVGAGSMGMVYAAYDPELNRRVAIKLLRTDAFASAQPRASVRARLVREAQALAQLAHPNAITVYDVGTHDGEVFLAMEFIEGGTTLADWLHREKRSIESTLTMFRQAGEGLAAAHAAGIVHRDFKPQNVLLGADGRVRVSDFGLARTTGGGLALAPAESAASPSPRAGGAHPASVTRASALLGTPAYMAPEQWEEGPTDARTDVFAFSVALYEALYGERPFAGDTPAELRAAVVRNEVRPAPRSKVPGSIRRVLLRGLRANPEERYPSMRAVLDELDRLPSRRRRIVLGFAAAAATALAALALRSPSSPPVCAGAAAAWGDAFDAVQEEAVHRAFQQSGDPSAEHVFASVERVLSDYRAAWIAMHTEACEATRVRGQQSEALLDLRMRCLDERRHGAHALVRSLGTGGVNLGHAAVAVSSLARIEDCADTRALAQPVPMPADPAKRARIADVAARAAEVEAEALNPQDGAGDTLTTIDALFAEAKEIGWTPLLARLRYDHGFCRSLLRMNREAEAELQEAAIAAQGAQADAIAVDAWTRLVYVIGYQEHRVDEGLLWGRYAEAALGRFASGEHRAAALYRIIGLSLLNDEARFDDARGYLEHALDLANKTDGPDSLSTALVAGALPLALFYVGRYAEAARREHELLPVLERLLGPENVHVALTLGNEGENLLELGRIDEAMALLRRSAEMQERMGRNDSALLNVLARALRRQRRLMEALETDRRSLALAEPNEPPDAYELSFALVGIAEDLLELGRAREALPLAERAAKLREETRMPSERGETRFALAQALWETGDKPRARRLAAQASADYGPTAERYGGRYRAALDDIDRWLASRAP